MRSGVMTNALISRACGHRRDVAVAGRAQRDRRVVDRVDQVDRVARRVVAVAVAVAVEVDQHHRADQDRDRQQQPAGRAPTRASAPAPATSSAADRQLGRDSSGTWRISVDHVAVDEDIGRRRHSTGAAQFASSRSRKLSPGTRSRATPASAARLRTAVPRRRRPPAPTRRSRSGTAHGSGSRRTRPRPSSGPGRPGRPRRRSGIRRAGTARHRRSRPASAGSRLPRFQSSTSSSLSCRPRDPGPTVRSGCAAARPAPCGRWSSTSAGTRCRRRR